MYQKLFFQNPNGMSFHYLEYLPPNYHTNHNIPLVVFLHGAGERGPRNGSALDLVAKFGYLRFVAEGQDYPFAIIAPQCPDDNYWGAYIESLNAFLDDRIRALGIDTDRIVLTGLSMGGTGSWMWGLANPKRFAGIAPVCGSGVVWFGMNLKSVPIWAFHGDTDSTVLPLESINMVGSVNKFGGNAKLTIYHGVNHNAWDYAYREPELIEWIMQRKKESTI